MNNGKESKKVLKKKKTLEDLLPRMEKWKLKGS
jgi:hypothetical protein